MIFRRSRPRQPGDPYRRRLIALSPPPTISAMVDVVLGDIAASGSALVRLPLQNVFGGMLPAGYRHRRRRRRPVAAVADIRLARIVAVAEGRVAAAPEGRVVPLRPRPRPAHAAMRAQIGNVSAAGIAVRGFTDEEAAFAELLLPLVGRGLSNYNKKILERLAGRRLTDEELAIAQLLLAA